MAVPCTPEGVHFIKLKPYIYIYLYIHMWCPMVHILVSGIERSPMSQGAMSSLSCRTWRRCCGQAPLSVFPQAFLLTGKLSVPGTLPRKNMDPGEVPRERWPSRGRCQVPRLCEGKVASSPTWVGAPNQVPESKTPNLNPKPKPQHLNTSPESRSNAPNLNL